MQALFAHRMKPYESTAEARRQLVKSIHDVHALFVWLFTLLPALAFYRERKIEDLKCKHHPTPEDLHPNMRFVDNRVIRHIDGNNGLRALCGQYRIDWSNDMDFVARVFHQIEETGLYEDYMSQDTADSYEADRKFVHGVIGEVFADNDYMHWFFGEKNPHWIDDYEEALLMVYKNIEDFRVSKGDDNKILALFKSDEDLDFCKDLFSKTLLHDAEFEALIVGKLQNWEADRVMSMDMLLMKMALCEFTQFPTVPVKVTINEYVDIAKLYSSDKSRQFVNGILDKVVLDLRDSGRLNKTGRGLIQN